MNKRRGNQYSGSEMFAGKEDARGNFHPRQLLGSNGKSSAYIRESDMLSREKESISYRDKTQTKPKLRIIVSMRDQDGSDIG